MTSAQQAPVLFDEKWVPPRTVLEGALEEDFKQVFVVGIDYKGDHIYASSTDDLVKNLSMLTEGLLVLRDYEASRR